MAGVVFAQPEEMGSVMLCTTGPYEFVEEIRGRLAVRGINLSLRWPRATTEASIFSLAGLSYIPPEERDEKRGLVRVPGALAPSPQWDDAAPDRGESDEDERWHDLLRREDCR